MQERFSVTMDMQKKCLNVDVGSERGKRKGDCTRTRGSALTVQKVTWNGKIQCLPTTQSEGEGKKDRGGRASAGERGGLECLLWNKLSFRVIICKWQPFKTEEGFNTDALLF